MKTPKPVKNFTFARSALEELMGPLREAAGKSRESVERSGVEFLGWWQLKHFLLLPLFGEMIQFDYFFSGALKPPTRFRWFETYLYIYTPYIIHLGGGLNFVVSFHPEPWEYDAKLTFIFCKTGEETTN